MKSYLPPYRPLYNFISLSTNALILLEIDGKDKTARSTDPLWKVLPLSEIDIAVYLMDSGNLVEDKLEVFGYPKNSLTQDGLRKRQPGSAGLYPPSLPFPLQGMSETLGFKQR